MINYSSKCKYHETLIEGFPDCAGFDDDNNCIGEILTYEPVGEVCHKLETHDFNCEGCKHFTEIVFSQIILTDEFEATFKWDEIEYDEDE